MSWLRISVPVILFLLFGCTPSTPVRYQLEEAYRCVWTYPDSTLKQLKKLPADNLPDDERMLYLLSYSIAASRSDTINPYTDLSEVIDHYRKQNQTSYLFVAIVHQAQLTGTTGNYKEALSLLQTAPSIDDVSVPARMRSLYHSIYGYLFRHSGDYRQALKHYDHSQCINLSEGYIDLTVSNAINIINMPGGLDADTLARFLQFYEPYVRQSRPSQQRKFYNNIGNYYKSNRDTILALSYYRKSLAIDSLNHAIISHLNYAELLTHYGHVEKAETIYNYVLLHADSTVLHRLYHHLFTQAIKQGEISKAQRYMKVYLESINQLYATRDRKELLEMQAKYDRSELLRKAERNRNTVMKFLLSFVAISILGYLIYTLSRIYQCYRLSYFLNEYCRVMRDYRAARQQALHQDEGYRQQESNLLNRLEEMKERIGDLMKESNRFRTIYRIKTPHMTVTPEDISALNLFQQLNKGKMKYEPAKHRSTLYHWVNLTDGLFAERLAQEYPLLKPHDLDLCCFYRMGFDNDHISGLYGQYSDSIRRHRLRLYPILGVHDKQSLDNLIHRF